MLNLRESMNKRYIIFQASVNVMSLAAERETRPIEVAMVWGPMP